MADLPTGTVTFLFTDIEGSTALWEHHPEAMRVALARHDELLEAAIDSHGGVIISRMGDGMAAAFASARDALSAALAAQQGLAVETWPEVLDKVRARMGLHTGEGTVIEEHYDSQPLNRCARLMAIGHGGQVLVSGTTEPLVHGGLPEGVELLDLGEHRLRDLSEPLRVFQLEGRGLDSDFPPLRSLNAVPGNLSIQVSSFVGREAEIATIASLLRSTRIVTLTGVGGVGKTRLGLQVAAEESAGYSDGVWLCELEAANDSTAMFELVADVLGARQRDGMSMADSVVEFVRSRELLIVLDNCEHLLADSGWLAAEISRRSPRARILATSREGLGIDGERLVAVASLRVPSVSEGFEAAVTTEAVRLFRDRAEAVRATFTLTERNLAPVVEICRRLDGMPLAIELAAARVTAMSPDEISARLDERFRLLSGGRRHRVERHQTLRATVDWSYSLLTETEQAVFDRLGVFVGSFSAAAVESVVTDDRIESWDALDALASLVEKSMVTADGLDERTTRYRLLETLRAFAREHLDAAEDSDRWRRRHATCYAEFCERAAPELWGPDELEWVARLEAELDNIRAVLSWARDAPSRADAEVGTRVMIALTSHALNVRWQVGEWAATYISQAHDSTQPDRAAIIAAAASWYMQHDNDEMAENLSREALALLPSGGRVTLAFCYHTLSALRLRQGRIADSLALVEEGKRAIDALESSSALTPQLSQVAVFDYLSLGEEESAQREADEALHRARISKNPSVLALALQCVGQACVRVDPDRALAALDEHKALVRGGAADPGHTIALAYSAQIRARKGDRAGALDDLRDAISFDHEHGRAVSLALTIERAVAILSIVGEDELAATCVGIVHSETLTRVRTLPQVDRTALRIADRLGASRYGAAHNRGSSLAFEDVGPTMLAELANLLGSSISDA